VSFGSIGRDSGEIEAIVLDRYLDSLLSRRPTDPDGVATGLRSVAARLVEELPRFHPSFGFEERLAQRLAEVALGLRLPLAAGAEGVVVPFGAAGAAGTARDVPPGPARDVDPRWWDELDALVASHLGQRPVVIGGVLTSAAISIAGAAFVAWRLRRPEAPMRRAARAVARSRMS
jgi:hypothetical protein